MTKSSVLLWRAPALTRSGLIHKRILGNLLYLEDYFTLMINPEYWGTTNNKNPEKERENMTLY